MHRSQQQWQSGGATLIMSMVVLFMVSLVAIVTAQIGAMEHRIAGNQYRAKQAYEAAQAGISDATRYLSRTDAISVGTPNINNRTITLVDEAGNNVNSKTLTSTDTANNTVNISSYSATYSTITANNFDQLLVTVSSQSVDTGAVRQVTQQMNFRSILRRQPDAPVIARTNVNMSGTSSVTNGNNVAGGISDAAIWTGGSMANAPAINVPSGTGKMTSDGTLAGLSTDSFFQNFFRYDKATTLARSTLVNCNPNCNETNASIQQIIANGGLLWVNGGGTLRLGQTGAVSLGTAAKPAILVMNNTTLRLEGGSTINGIVYVAGNWSNNNFTGTVNGAVLVEGTLSGNNLNIVYDANPANPPITNVMNLGNYAPIPGTWKDF